MGERSSYPGSNVIFLSEVRRQRAEQLRPCAETTTAPVAPCSNRDTVYFVTGGRYECMVNNAVGILRAGEFLRVPHGAAHAFTDIGEMAGSIVSHRFRTGVPSGLLREIAEALPPYAHAFPCTGTAAFQRLEAIARRWGVLLDTAA